jgi:hypothetical protein
MLPAALGISYASGHPLADQRMFELGDLADDADHKGLAGVFHIDAQRVLARGSLSGPRSKR